MSEIFISYSRRDAEIIDKIVEIFNQAGMSVWLDRDDIKAGNSWRVQIVEAIDSCDAFVFMLSGNSAASKNVHKEVILAQDSGRAIFVMMLEPVKPPAEIRYQLAGLQFIDFQMLGFDKAVDQLIKTLKEHLKKRPVGEQTHNQVELVIQGINISAFTAEKQQQLLAFISTLANADQSQVKIANMTAGSVHVFVDMPAAAAFQLKTLALNRDQRFKEIGITSFRLAGGAKFINISLGILTSAATLSPIKSFWLRIQSFFSSIFGITAGNIIMILTAALVIAGIAISALSLLTAPQPASTPAPLSPLTETPTTTFTPTPSSAETAASRSTPAITASPASSLTGTDTPVPAYQTFNAVVRSERIACRYGPGDLYLYQYGLIQGNKMQVVGRDINSTWGYAQVEGYEKPCWVNFKYIDLDPEVSSLESVYPGKVEIPLSFLWPEPKNVTAARTADGNKVAIYWDEYLLPLGEREGEDSPRYLAELWLCKDGVLTFTSLGTMQPNLLVTDEPGCSGTSGGVVYLVEKHGYAGPVKVLWPPFPIPTP